MLPLPRRIRRGAPRAVGSRASVDGISGPMPTLTPDRLRDLELKANDIRQGIIRSLHAAGSGHSAGPLDMSDVFAALYGTLMRHDPRTPGLAAARPPAAIVRPYRAGTLFGHGQLRIFSGRGTADAAKVRFARCKATRNASRCRR